MAACPTIWNSVIIGLPLWVSIQLLHILNNRTAPSKQPVLSARPRPFQTPRNNLTEKVSLLHGGGNVLQIHSKSQSLVRASKRAKVADEMSCVSCVMWTKCLRATAARKRWDRWVSLLFCLRIGVPGLASLSAFCFFSIFFSRAQ